MIALQDLLDATGGRLDGTAHATQFSDFAFDSRRLGEALRYSEGTAGPLFVAVRTATGDGHEYISEAISRGATGVLCEHIPRTLSLAVTCVTVPDTQQALLDWAAHALRKHSPRVIAVTGSSGKTTTKEAIAAVLGQSLPVFRNYDSYSGRYGLPIALGRLGPAHRVAVLELAADSVGEIGDLARLTRPETGVVTTVNLAHGDTLGSLPAIANEKAQLIAQLPEEGLAVLNRDDRLVWGMRAIARARVVSYGFHPEADVRVEEAQYTRDGLLLRVRLPGQMVSRTLPLRLFGRHHAYVALAALAVGQHYGVPVEEALSALAELSPLAGRLCPLDGLGGTILLDDTYDADPATAMAALDTLVAHFPASRKVLVLGRLRGQVDPRVAYRAIGTRAAEAVDGLVLKGEETQAVREAAQSAGMPRDSVFETFTNAEAARHLAETVGRYGVILVKGSREDRMEEIVRDLMQDGARAPYVLVRQQDAYRHVQRALPERPTWIEVDLAVIADNLMHIGRLVGASVSIMVVLKADGYGHGAVRIARTALNNGAQMLGVACLSEAIGLRRAGIGAPILVLGYTPPWQAREAVRNGITSTVFDLQTAQAFSRAATETGGLARVHVKVDTGMGRLGLLVPEAAETIECIARLPDLEVEGVFTHFSVADDADKAYTYAQLDRFRKVLDRLACAGIQPRFVHAANSAAALTVPEAHLSMVRVGIALYGLAPSRDTPLPAGFAPALAFKTRIAQVKELPAGSYVSYGNTYRTPGPERIAVIPVGYADGFRRAPAHWGTVLVRGQRAPIVGRVCMDQTMIDVTHIAGARQGDEVVLIGQQGEDAITVDEVAARLGTINYEVVSEILARVPRVS